VPVVTLQARSAGQRAFWGQGDGAAGSRRRTEQPRGSSKLPRGSVWGEGHPCQGAAGEAAGDGYGETAPALGL